MRYSTDRHIDHTTDTRRAGFHSRSFRSEPITSRPDRIAFWAVILAVVAMLAAAGSSRAATGSADAEQPGAGSQPRAALVQPPAPTNQR